MLRRSLYPHIDVIWRRYVCDKEGQLRFHHFAITVSDMDRSLECYRDLLGLDVALDVVIPDSPPAGEDPVVSDDLMRVTLGRGKRGTRARMVYLTSPEGVAIEVLEPQAPEVSRKDLEDFRFPRTTMHELAFHITDIDDWFDRVRTAGYETQTDHVWMWRTESFRSFIFYDPDGHAVQLVDDPTFLADDGGAV